MIRPETLALSTDTFATGRKGLMESTDDRLRPHIADALARVGLPQWQAPVVNLALDVFDETARTEVDHWSQVLDDMRDAFAKELSDALDKTGKDTNFDAQVERLTRWISAMSINAATEAATTSDTSADVGLEWITMHDTHVRSMHREASGQTVPTGHAFEVGGVKMFYPGQPVGSPEHWLNCRCVARPTMLGEAAGKTLTASGAPGVHKDGTPPMCKYCKDTSTQYVLHSEAMAYIPTCDEHLDQAKEDAANCTPNGERNPDNIDRITQYSITENLGLSEEYKANLLARYSGTVLDASITASADNPIPTVVIVALPAEDDPATSASSEEDGAHATLLFLGDASALNKNDLTSTLDDFFASTQTAPFTDRVSGRATLGAGKADVILLDGAGLVGLRNNLLTQDYIADAYADVEQFPTFVPHVTLGYPETPANDPEFSGDSISFDRLALWFGEDRSTIYTLGGNEVSPQQQASVIHAEDEAFTQDMADKFADSVPEGKEPGPAPVTQGEIPTEVKWHGVLAPEGKPSGDGRQFAKGSLTHRQLPLPLKAMFTDDEGHKGSVVVGRIDNIFRDGNLVKASGVFDDSPEAAKAHGMLARKMWRGVSVDVDAAEITALAADDETGQDITEFAAARIASATMCAIPAFAEAYLAIGDFAAQTGVDEEPQPPEDEPQPKLPEHMASDTETMTGVSLVASLVPTVSADFFRNPELTEPTPLTITEDGRVFGHVASWDTCHITYDICVTPPPSQTDYGYFLAGQVFTDAGPVGVGQITLGGGHADGNKSLRAAVAHYDNVATAVADITTGEDDHGIWFSGKLRDGVTSQQIAELRATGVSGDWREVRVAGANSFEMIAAHSVNVPGFPIRRGRATYSNGHQVSLIAAGVLAESKPALDPEFAAQMDAYKAREERVATAAALRQSARAQQASLIKNKFNAQGAK